MDVWKESLFEKGGGKLVLIGCVRGGFYYYHVFLFQRFEQKQIYSLTQPNIYAWVDLKAVCFSAAHSTNKLDF